ncbi:ferredoxin domain-containing protein [Syntrophotalea carbinolica]|nr:DUF2148 domain-containing protein [Syntrophotalea carbinolica]
MLLFDDEKNGMLEMARMICAAARTAPKGRSMDLLTTAIVDGEEKDRLAERMRHIGKRDGLAFFERDAGNVSQAQLIILFGNKNQPLGLPKCGYCGFDSCQELKRAGGVCAFNSGDLGIAIGSAVSRAADLRIDNRILYTAGKAALELGLLGEDIALAYGLPLSITGKNPFFDRK